MTPNEQLATSNVNFGAQRSFEQEAEHFDSFAAENNLKSNWSIFGLDIIMHQTHYGRPKGRKITYIHHFGPKQVTTTVEGDTWGDLFKAADKLIAMSRDEHHIYIEDFEWLEDGTLELVTGS